MRDLIKARAAHLKRVQSKKEAVQASVRELADTLESELGHLQVSGESSIVRVEAPPGVAESPTELRWRFENHRLLVVAGDDLSDVARRDIYDGFSGYLESTWTPDRCPEYWLAPLLATEVVTSLVHNIGGDRLDDKEARLDGVLAAVRTLLSAESAAIDAEMSESLDAAGDDNLVRLWQDAVDATYAETADALTRCSRFLEATCAKILRERGIALPKDKSMSPLVKACLDTLTWPDAKEAEEDVRRLLGGIQGICGAIGALRTHFGTAHGASSHLPPLDPGYAVFVKQATVAAAHFLLNRHQVNPPVPRTDDASSAPR
ncbi:MULTISPECIES: abortive infection family protein [Burkholderia]|uniref:Abortive infection protein-like C-terminal domain-containing protein n=1 Tax=Burkholderia aenigmatica TaxID=2015348 RepID=A0A6J5JLF4_9BURK|nr:MULTISPECIES: abortive infection family protein [Burkholderia]CAB3972622.1 hypothetical protein BLA3211_07061 [Burkholderia aenigmatica]